MEIPKKGERKVDSNRTSRHLNFYASYDLHVFFHAVKYRIGIITGYRASIATRVSHTQDWRIDDENDLK